MLPNHPEENLFQRILMQCNLQWWWWRRWRKMGSGMMLSTFFLTFCPQWFETFFINAKNALRIMGKKEKGVKIQIKAKVVFELSPGNFSLFFSVNFDGIKTDQNWPFLQQRRRFSWMFWCPELQYTKQR